MDFKRSRLTSNQLNPINIISDLETDMTAKHEDFPEVHGFFSLL